MLAMAAALMFPLASAAVQDTVTIAGSTGGQMKITGRVVDYTGRELILEHPGGRQQRFAAEKVLAVEAPSGPARAQADELFASGRFDDALGLYLKAVDEEPRRWVRRQMIAQVVWCYRALDRPQQAGEAFLLLIRSDPHTPYFDGIPLAWMPRQPPITLEQTARQWLGRDEPAAVLLGASHLLTTNARATALARLKQLSAGADRRVAELAAAQIWRAEVATADAERLDGWGRAIERMPESLAAGPYFVLGQALAQRKQWEQAALALLRVAILYPQQRALAAQSLSDAGRALEKLDQTEEAVRLYRELIRSYPQQKRPVAEAQSRLEEIGKRPPPSGARE